MRRSLIAICLGFACISTAGFAQDHQESSQEQKNTNSKPVDHAGKKIVLSEKFLAHLQKSGVRFITTNELFQVINDREKSGQPFKTIVSVDGFTDREGENRNVTYMSALTKKQALNDSLSPRSSLILASGLPLHYRNVTGTLNKPKLNSFYDLLEEEGNKAVFLVTHQDLRTLEAQFTRYPEHVSNWLRNSTIIVTPNDPLPMVSILSRIASSKSSKQFTHLLYGGSPQSLSRALSLTTMFENSVRHAKSDSSLHIKLFPYALRSTNWAFFNAAKVYGALFASRQFIGEHIRLSLYNLDGSPVPFSAAKGLNAPGPLEEERDSNKELPALSRDGVLAEFAERREYYNAYLHQSYRLFALKFNRELAEISQTPPGQKMRDEFLQTKANFERYLTRTQEYVDKMVEVDRTNPSLMTEFSKSHAAFVIAQNHWWTAHQKVMEANRSTIQSIDEKRTEYSAQKLKEFDELKLTIAANERNLNFFIGSIAGGSFSFGITSNDVYQKLATKQGTALGVFSLLTEWKRNLSALAPAMQKHFEPLMSLLGDSSNSYMSVSYLLELYAIKDGVSSDQSGAYFMQNMQKNGLLVSLDQLNDVASGSKEFINFVSAQRLRSIERGPKL